MKYWWAMMIELSAKIRTNAAGVLSRKISLQLMHNSLNDLFVDRTAIDTSLRRLMTKENIEKTIVYNDCMAFNDKDTIEFNTHLSQVQDFIKPQNNRFTGGDG